MVSLYQPSIRIHASRMKGGSDLRRDSTADPSSAALWRRTYWRLALVKRMSSLEVRWDPFRRSTILTLMRRQISYDINTCRRCSRWGGLGMAS